MRLKRLELQGYKSFADRTEFVFPTGITAIVGPNGSGKSNIADAIRWALGEQSLRLLRGKTTEDMIFSGGGRRARAGMAQVLLTLDNGDGWLPVDFAEVTLGRRAYRSGESEYLLNGNRVRLRDLMDLLAESGLAQRTYTVIGQGLVDMALSLQPQERRALFEEAAGISVYRARREEAAAQLDETERNLDRVRDLLSEIAPRLKRLEEQMARFQEYERVSGYLKQLQRAWYGYHWGQAQQALQAAQARARAAEEALAARQAEADAVAARLADLRHRQTELRNDLRDAYRRVADLHERMDAAQRELAALTERSRLLEAREKELEGEMEPLQAQETAQAERVRAAQAQEAELRERVAAQEARVAAMEAELARLRHHVREQAAQRDRIEAELRALRARRAELEKALAETRALQARLEAEQELLARMRDEMAGLAEGTRRLLQAGLPGVIGLVSQILRVPPEWERAVEAALGPRLQAVIVEGWETVRAARRALGENGRAVLFPLTPSPLLAFGQERGGGAAAGLGPKGLRPEGGGGGVRSTAVVSCEERFRPVVEALLGRVWLVEDLEAARALAPTLPPGGRCVTREGEIVAADGTVTVGRAEGGLLARERAWTELPGRLEAVRRKREEQEAELVRVAQAIDEGEARRQEAGRAADEAAARLAQAESPLAQARTDLALARQALENGRTLLAREQTALDRVRREIEARRARLADVRRERETVRKRLDDLQQETGRYEAALRETRARIVPAEEELSRLAAEQEAAEADERRVSARIRQAEEGWNAARLEVSRAQDRLTRLQERIQEDLGLVDLEVRSPVRLQQPLPLEPLVTSLPIVEVLPEGLEEEIHRLKARLRQLGPINPGAPQEYAEVSERHRFLSEQVADLEAASARLRAVIAELDQMMERAFRETFEAVAQAFEENFTRLFNGGSARLELTDPDDPARAGVDILARPPGKRLQSLALLSGGERALTAVALIFAILKVRPTPFCVLDEVDAMLDEANVARFRDLLTELSERTQFIVITHNRGTVEAADTVYGVSMGPDGVSQVLSLRLDGTKDADERG